MSFELLKRDIIKKGRIVLNKKIDDQESRKYVMFFENLLKNMHFFYNDKLYFVDLDHSGIIFRIVEADQWLFDKVYQTILDYYMNTHKYIHINDVLKYVKGDLYTIKKYFNMIPHVYKSSFEFINSEIIKNKHIVYGFEVSNIEYLEDVYLYDEYNVIDIKGVEKYCVDIYNRIKNTIVYLNVELDGRFTVNDIYEKVIVHETDYCVEYDDVDEFKKFIKEYLEKNSEDMFNYYKLVKYDDEFSNGGFWYIIKKEDIKGV